MLSILDKKQLNHLKNLVNTFYSIIGRGIPNDGFAVSDWYYTNIYDSNSKTGAKLEIYGYEHALIKSTSDIIKKIISIETTQITDKNHKQAVLSNYKANLIKFDNDSVEYRKWIILQIADQGIPKMHRTYYNTTTLLKRLDVDYLYNLKSRVKRTIREDKFYEKVNEFEPYFYELMYDLEYNVINSASDEAKAFIKAQSILIQNISSIIAEKNSIYAQYEMQNEKLKNSYRSTVRNKFGGDSVEYRKWIILCVTNEKIPGISHTFNTSKILKKLPISELEKLKEKINRSWYYHYKDYRAVKLFEPYLYKLMLKTSNKREKKGNKTNLVNYKSDEVNAFKTAKSFLVSEISEIISQKTKYEKVKTSKDDSLIDTSKVIKKIEKLKSSPRFYEDVIDILYEAQSDINETNLKLAIGEYSKPGVTGSVYNIFLRRAIFLKKLSEGKIANVNFSKFRSHILKVREYFLKHLTEYPYTVYRGIKNDGLIKLLKTANPKIAIKSVNEMLQDINDKKPVVFDEGLVSTSLIAHIAADRFGGKKRGSTFFTIYIPKGSPALVLGYEGIENEPQEEEILLAERTKIKINSMKTVGYHFEIEAIVVR